jgi:hypothetical protein
MHLAQNHPDWALGLEDEVWWSRVAQPSAHAWQAPEQPVRLVEQTLTPDDPDPKALACYGLLVRRGSVPEQVWLRFVEGRPVSAITTQFLEWCCTKLAARAVPVWRLFWDNASWQGSKAVRTWIRSQNQQVKQEQKGVRILSCALPVKSRLAQPDRTQVGPQQTGDCRTSPPAESPRGRGAGVSVFGICS